MCVLALHRLDLTLFEPRNISGGKAFLPHIILVEVVPSYYPFTPHIFCSPSDNPVLSHLLQFIAEFA